VKDKILAHLDISKPLEKSQKGKLVQNLELCLSAKLQVGNLREAAVKQKKKNSDSVPSLIDLLRLKEKEVNPLTYNCDFSRLTQLFQRPLQIKYYTKK